MSKIIDIKNMITIRNLLPIPEKNIHRDFWSGDVLNEIRTASLTGRPQRIFRNSKRIYRILDRLSFGHEEIKLKGDERPTSSVNSEIAGIEVAAPIYLADMSFGALSGIPNVVEAELADELGLLSGTGEGGLHPEVARHRRIFVQWASARFGVDITTLMSGMGIVIKIGQGAKPGIGGHLPGNKVTSVISMVRRIPVGIDALSPAPHHDIYSIEDLKQRIEALKEATGKPVLVKVAATNYIPYIASGIARMGADGIIIDGHGAGTGATPLVVRDNIGIPIELAIASVDQILRREGIRDRVTLIAAGRVSNADDAAKLIALGADAVSLGTALLISMGCVMARTCHRGNCPAGITSRLVDGTKVVDYELAKNGARNFLNSFIRELGLILDHLGINDVKKLVGRRDLLRGRCITEELASILGIKSDEECEGVDLVVNDNQLWSPDYSIYANQLSLKGGSVIVSMGSTGPPEVELPRKLIDWVRFDGAQVTKPAIDPYRENINVSIELMRGGLKLSMPIILRPTVLFNNGEMIEILKLITNVLMVAMDMSNFDNVGSNKRLSRVLWNKPIEGLGALIVDYGKVEGRFNDLSLPIYIRVGTNVDMHDLIDFMSVNLDLIHGVIIDEELGVGEYPEVFLVGLDRELRRIGIRYDIDILIHMRNVRSSGDVVKLIALGANAVEVSSLMERSLHGYANTEEFIEKVLKFLLALRKEVALMLGAAGIYSITSVIGNRELLRALDPRVKKLLLV
ncbi:MAG: glutamate synthase-related protein, partial [Vulcanisaeta sp.]|nr:glutamate synthase-related protein [Vulcanisaeta sp.]